MTLSWLPRHVSWDNDLQQIRRRPSPDAKTQLTRLAHYSLDFLQTLKLDRALLSLEENEQQSLDTRPILKLAFLGSSTLSHLLSGIRIGAVRRGLRVEIYEGRYGQYRQELSDPASELYEFRPDVVLLALDARHMFSEEESSPQQVFADMRACWQLAKERLGATVIQQTVMPLFLPVIGENENVYPLSPAAKVQELNHRLRRESVDEGIHLLSVDAMAQVDGITAWSDPALWHRAKQEVHPQMSPVYGDHVARLLAALRGNPYKCLVLDLDNTLWGGVIGDDGLEGILLGQGHAVGEAFSSFQRYVKRLAARGVILAVCSKNDLSNALMPFQDLAEMQLRREDVSCFIANWEDKAVNLRQIAATLNIGLDSLVFVDDNPFERNLIRQELPMVAVPEMPDDPALYESTLAAAGYFEALTVTDEDLQRVSQYRQNAARVRLKEEVTDLAGYLKRLDMRLLWAPFDTVSLPRITQLINKSNQFNLTTRRYTQDQVNDFADDPTMLTLQLRLLDSFGDNGTIAIIIGRMTDTQTLEIDTWLMSCRVLGRQVEEATVNLVVERARILGARYITGVYIPSKKNGLVKDLFKKLGFSKALDLDPSASRWTLAIDHYEPRQTFALTEAAGTEPRTLEPTPIRTGGSHEQPTDLYATY